MAAKSGDEVRLGKKYAGEAFSTVKSVEDAIEEVGLAQRYGQDEGAIDIEMYFNRIRANDPVRKAMMLSYTKVRRATVAAFDEIFKTF